MRFNKFIKEMEKHPLDDALEKIIKRYLPSCVFKRMKSINNYMYNNMPEKDKGYLEPFFLFYQYYKMLKAGELLKEENENELIRFSCSIPNGNNYTILKDSYGASANLIMGLKCSYENKIQKYYKAVTDIVNKMPEKIKKSKRKVFNVLGRRGENLVKDTDRTIETLLNI